MLVLKLGFFFIVIQSAGALVAYQCHSDSPSIKVLSTKDTDECITRDLNITESEVRVQILQPKLFDTVNYFSCLIEIQHFIYRCGKTFDNIHSNALVSEVLEIGKVDCKKLVRTGIFFYSGIEIKINQNLSINKFSTETYGVIEKGSCTPGSYDKPLIMNGKSYERAVRTSEFSITLLHGRASIDLEDNKVILPEGLTCKFSNDFCFSASLGWVYWDGVFKTSLCQGEKEYMVIFEGMSTRIEEHHEDYKSISYLIHYSDYDFQLAITGKRKRICSQDVLMSEHPKLGIIEDRNGFAFKYDPGKISSNLDLMTYTNSKLLYVMKNMKSQINSLYSALSHDRCLTEQRVARNLLSIARLNPLEFVYNYMGGPGYSAVVRGEAIYIIKCTPVYVNATKVPLDKCYNELPVLYNGDLFFMTPTHRIITPTATEVECSTIFTPKFHLDKNWFNVYKSSILRDKELEKLSFNPTLDWKFNDIKDLSDAGIYTPDEISQLSKIILEPFKDKSTSLNFNRMIQGEGLENNGVHLINALTPDDFEKIGKRSFDSFLDKTFGYVLKGGSIVSFIIGMIFVIRIFKFFANFIINTTILYQTLGWSWKLLFAWWENLVHLFLREEKTTKKPIEETDIPLTSILSDKESKTADSSCKDKIKYDLRMV